MVAISVMMIAMMAVFGVLSQTLSLNRVAADQYVAANLASEGIEIIKNLVDSEYDYDHPEAYVFGSSVYSMLGKKCAVDINTAPNDCKSDDIIRFDEQSGYSLDADSPTKFSRYVELSKPLGESYIKVSSTVEWRQRGGGQATITVVDTLYDWRSD